MSLILSGTNGLSDVDGSAATPAIRGTDTNTGIFFPAADTIAFAEGGVEAMRLDSAGNMGLGVTPAAWGSPFKAFQFGPNGGSLNARTDSNQAVELALNWYYDGAANRYIYSNFATKYRQFAGGHEWYTSAFGTAGNTVTFTQAMTLDASGNLGVGTTSPAQRLDVQGALGRILLTSTTGTNNCLSGYTNTGGTAYVGLDSSGGGLGASYGLAVYHGGAYPIVFSTNATERARITSSGDLLVGITSIQSGNAADSVGASIYGNGAGGANQGATILVRNNSSGYVLYVNNKASTGGLVQFYNNGNNVGAITSNGTGTTYGTSSDYRLKENVQPMTGALAKVAALKPCTYTWKADDSSGQGFIAHELQAVVPDAVVGEKDAVDEDGNIKPQSIDTSFLVATLTAAIQEQQAIIEQLQADVAALKAKA